MGYLEYVAAVTPRGRGRRARSTPAGRRDCISAGPDRTASRSLKAYPAYHAPRVETDAHHVLKRGAVEFLGNLGCRVLATEVRCPISRWLVDVAGWLDRPPGADPDSRCDPRTVMIECKQSRADFLRDSEDVDRLTDLRAALQRISTHLEERRVKANEPHLRRGGGSLFPELEHWDFHRSRLDGYRRVVQRLRRLEQRLHGETKFFMVARYHLADHLYLAAPRGMIHPRELPAGWGLLECPRRPLRRGAERAALRVAVAAPDLDTRPEHRTRLLRNIAAAACRPVLASASSVA